MNEKTIKKPPLDRYYNVDIFYGLLSEFKIRREIKRLKSIQRETLMKMESLEAALKRSPDMEIESVPNSKYKSIWLNENCPYTPKGRGMRPNEEYLLKNGEYIKYE